MTEASAPPSNRAIPAVTSLNDLRSYRSLGRELTGQSERMLTATGFGDAIRDVGPETQAIYAEHLSDMRENSCTLSYRTFANLRSPRSTHTTTTF